MHHVAIITKTIAVQTLILEGAADTEDNIVDMLKAGYRTKTPYIM